MLLVIQLITSSRRMRYPVGLWIHCCKRPNYDFYISHGNAV